jgi:ADP-ribose pyrophosphatase YjhB (NUDIX family)
MKELTMTAVSRELRCPTCGSPVKEYRNPVPTVDIIIEVEDGIVLILRKNEPRQWALPGGFCDYGESLEDAAVREAEEETGLEVELLEQFYTYSRPDRDPRHHTITTVYIGQALGGFLEARDDARDIGVFTEGTAPRDLAFDHARIVEDFFRYRKTERRPELAST